VTKSALFLPFPRFWSWVWWYAGILFCTKRLFINRMKKICNNHFCKERMLDAWTFIYCGFMDKWISYFETIAAFHI